MKKMILLITLFSSVIWAAPQWFEGTSEVRVDNPQSSLVTITGDSARVITERLKTEGVPEPKCGPITYYQGESITCSHNSDQGAYYCSQWIGNGGRTQAVTPYCPQPSMGVRN